MFREIIELFRIYPTPEKNVFFYISTNQFSEYFEKKKKRIARDF